MENMTGNNKDLGYILFAGHVFTLPDRFTFFAEVFETVNSINNLRYA